MNAKTVVRILRTTAALSTLFSVLTLAAPAFGTALSWDPSGTGTGSAGGSGAWDNFSSQWYSSSIPGDTSWSQTDAAFAGTAGTVTISSGITANNLFFYTSGYQITGNTLNLTGGTISVLPKNASDTINSAITGNGSSVGLTQTGTGTLTLNGPAFYTGPTNVSSGTLLINGINTTTGGTLGVGSKTFGTLGGSGSAAAATFTVNPSSKNGIIAGYDGSGSLTIGGLDFQGGRQHLHCQRQPVLLLGRGRGDRQQRPDGRRRRTPSASS